MKHHCHCGFFKRHAHFKAKRFGALGAVLMVLHLLYHVAECLVLPAIFVGLSHGHDDTAAVSDETYESLNITDRPDTLTQSGQLTFAEAAKYAAPLSLSTARGIFVYDLSN